MMRPDPADFRREPPAAKPGWHPSEILLVGLIVAGFAAGAMRWMT